MNYKLILWIGFLISITQSINVIISSNGVNRTLPRPLQFSCQLPVLAVHFNTSILYLLDLPKSLTQIEVRFQQLNLTLRMCPYNQSEIAVNVSVQGYPVGAQITQKITINMDGQIHQRKVYILKCQSSQTKYDITLPSLSISLTQLLAAILVVLLPYNIHYRRFKPWTFNTLFALIYSLILLAGVYFSIYLNHLQIQRYVIAGFSIIFIYLYLQDIFSIFLQNRYLLDSISIILAGLLIVTDLVLIPDAWFINNIIASLVAGAIIKFLVVRKIRASILPLSLLWIFFVLRQFAIDFRIQNFEETLGLDLIPLYLQIPALNDIGYSCSAFGTSKIIAFGILLNYFVRVDLYLSSRFYQFLGYILAIICLGVQLALNILLDELPTMSFLGIIIFIPTALTLTLFFANKRGQWAQFWHGSFFDMTVNRISIPRKSNIQDSVSDDFGENLRLNPTLLSH